jgi:site-specific DNA-methyltransferase (adenine-specific)
MSAPYYADDHVTLYHGDCLEFADVWTAADVLVTDPPYGYAYASGRADTAWPEAIANDTDTAARDAVLSLWGAGPALVFGSWKRDRPMGVRALLIWDKGLASGMGDLSVPWKPNTEEVYVLGSGFVGHRGSSVLTGHNVVTWASKGREHPNMKPRTLMEALIVKCPPGVVADPFAGSGSTLVAAKALGRQAIGVEIDEQYCEISAKRLSQGVLDFGEAL